MKTILVLAVVMGILVVVGMVARGASARAIAREARAAGQATKHAEFNSKIEDENEVLPDGQEDEDEKRLVDMHCHVAGIGAGGSGCFVSQKLEHNWRFDVYLHSFGVSKKEVLAKGDRVVADRISEMLAQSKYVSKAVVLAMDGVVDANGNLDTNRTEVYVPNEFVAEMAATHSNLLFAASVNPLRPDALERLEWAKAHGAVLVKWLPAIMDFDPSDPRCIPFYKKLVELNLPLLSHTGKEGSFSRANDALSDPEKLRLPLSLGVTVIAAHEAAGGSYHGERSIDRLARMLPEYTNLYTDISALTQINRMGYLREGLQRPEFAGRLVYGTDFPLINTPLVSPWWSLHLTLGQRWKIARTKNPWDRDVMTKHYMGVTTETFERFERKFLGQKTQEATTKTPRHQELLATD